MKKQCNQTYIPSSPIPIISTASIVGPKEKEGPLHEYFDQCLEDEFWGEKTWEKAESKIIKETVNSLSFTYILESKFLSYVLLLLILIAISLNTFSISLGFFPHITLYLNETTIASHNTLSKSSLERYLYAAINMEIGCLRLNIFNNDTYS